MILTHDKGHVINQEIFHMSNLFFSNLIRRLYLKDNVKPFAHSLN